MTANLPQQTPIQKLDDESEKRIAEIADYYFNDDGMGRYRCIKATREYQLELAGLRAKAEAETIERCAKVADEWADDNDVKQSEADGMDMRDAATYHKGARVQLARCAAAIRALQPLPKSGE